MKIYNLSTLSFNKEIHDKIRKLTPPPGKIMDDEDGQGYSKRPQSTMDEDMPSLDDLQDEAAIACELRGHHLENWKTLNNDQEIIQEIIALFVQKKLSYAKIHP